MPLTPETIERAARAFAEALNGGGWTTHYTETQRDGDALTIYRWS